MSTPLWELLIKINSKSKKTLTCSECFAVIELLAEGARLDIDQELLEQLARDHLAKCPDCRDQLWQRLSDLEAMVH